MKYKTFSVSKLITMEEYSRDYRDTEKFISFCKACENYNSCWACPPFDFNTNEVLSKFKNAYIIGTKITPLEKQIENFDYKTLLANVRKSLDEKLLQLEQKYPDSMAFFAGTCSSCPENKCTRKTDRPCVQTDKMRYSLESFGFDMEKTSSKLLNIELKWTKKGEALEYFTLLSGFLTNHNINKF